MTQKQVADLALHRIHQGRMQHLRVRLGNEVNYLTLRHQDMTPPPVAEVELKEKLEAAIVALENCL